MVLATATLTLLINPSVECKYLSADGYLGEATKSKPPAIILLHKQALTQDGAFNFAFAGDNGIKQGESIRPDGTRTGAYSYIDPNGETISVKYTAGKDGFKILEGDHIPRSPVAAAATPFQKYMSPSEIDTDDNSFLPRLQSSPLSDYESAAVATNSKDTIFRPKGSYSEVDNPNFKTLYSVYEESASENHSPRVHPHSASSKVSYESEEDDHRGPHSFGTGYSFEFGQSQ